MPEQNPYKILEVETSASQDEIKKAFRKKAHLYHPDKPNGDEQKFKEINAAYQILSDPKKRQQYDQFGSAAFGNGGGGGGQGFGGFDFSGAGGAGFEDLGDIFGDMFGFGGRGRPRRTQRGNDIQVDLDLTFEEAVFGTDQDITLTRPITCERCAGQAAEPGTDLKTCSDCNGQGVRMQVQRTILGNIQSRVTCGGCNGEGKIPEKQCTTCDGAGVEKKKTTITVSVPAGVDNGDTVRLREQGEAVKGGTTGDLFLRIHVKADKRFEREGKTIYSERKIGITQAALGDTVDVETVDGKVALKIPSGTQSNTKFKLKGKGVDHRTGRGDHIVIVDVVIPKKLSGKQKELIKKLNLKED